MAVKPLLAYLEVNREFSLAAASYCESAEETSVESESFTCLECQTCNYSEAAPCQGCGLISLGKPTIPHTVVSVLTTCSPASQSDSLCDSERFLKRRIPRVEEGIMIGGVRFSSKRRKLNNSVLDNHTSSSSSNGCLPSPYSRCNCVSFSVHQVWLNGICFTNETQLAGVMNNKFIEFKININGKVKNVKILLKHFTAFLSCLVYKVIFVTFDSDFHSSLYNEFGIRRNTGEPYDNKAKWCVMKLHSMSSEHGPFIQDAIRKINPNTESSNSRFQYNISTTVADAYFNQLGLSSLLQSLTRRSAHVPEVLPISSASSNNSFLPPLASVTSLGSTQQHMLVSKKTVIAPTFTPASENLNRPIGVSSALSVANNGPLSMSRIFNMSPTTRSPSGIQFMRPPMSRSGTVQHTRPLSVLNHSGSGSKIFLLNNDRVQNLQFLRLETSSQLSNGNQHSQSMSSAQQQTVSFSGSTPNFRPASFPSLTRPLMTSRPIPESPVVITPSPKTVAVTMVESSVVDQQPCASDNMDTSDDLIIVSEQKAPVVAATDVPSSTVNQTVGHFPQLDQQHLLHTQLIAQMHNNVLIHRVDSSQHQQFQQLSTAQNTSNVTLFTTSSPSVTAPAPGTTGMLTTLTMPNGTTVMQLTAGQELVPKPRITGTPIEKFTYTPGGSNGITLTNDDVLCLNEGVYLNDVIIDFYLKYILHELMTERQRERTHIFTCFFYNRLTQPQTNRKPGESEMESRHASVAKWTRRVDIFDKDFIIIPINENSHWFLAIVCFAWMSGTVSYTNLLQSKTNSDIPPPAVGSALDSIREIYTNDEEESSAFNIQRAKRVKELKEEMGIEPMPCILLFDSLIGAPRAPNVRVLRDYLQMEWNTKRMERDGKLTFDKDTVRGFSPRVPQQPNFIDCGIYVLHYGELFFTDPVTSFTKDYFQDNMKDWFSVDAVKNKRACIQDLIIEKYTEYARQKDTDSETKDVHGADDLEVATPCFPSVNESPAPQQDTSELVTLQAIPTAS